jgi:hypothetical protein
MPDNTAEVPVPQPQPNPYLGLQNGGPGLGVNAVNPYNYPTIVEVEHLVNGQVASEFHEFSDLQQAWMWARDQTNVYDFPFNEQPYGDHAGWDFMSFSFLKQEIEAHPDEEFEVFSKNAEKNFLIYYKDDEDDEEDEEDDDLPPLIVVPPGGSPPGGSPAIPPLEITPEIIFAALGVDPHANCPHGLPFYACMPCSH